MTKTLTLNSDAEYDAVIAALRLLARVLNASTGEPITVVPNDGDIGDILTNDGEHGGLSAGEVHDIADRFQAA